MAETQVVPFVIHGKDLHPEKTFQVQSPSTGQILYKSGSASVADAIKATDAAAEALPSWRRTTPQQRQVIFLKAAEIMQNRARELTKYIEDETGCTRKWAEFNVAHAIGMIKDVAGRLSALIGSFLRLSDPKRQAIIRREPFGVVLSIAPWNAPYVLGSRSIVFPAGAGNTVVLKASELCPKTMWALVDVFREAGLPDGVLNMIVCEPADAAAVTSALICDPRVRKINFTGSTNVGRIIARQAGEQLKPVVLELGGKAPAIVWEDADLDLAARLCALGSLANNGQICMSTERILVHRAVGAAFRQKLVAAVSEMFPSSEEAPVLINDMAVQRNKRLVNDATEHGASILYGDAKAQESRAARMRPVVVDGVTTDMEIFKTESFGPTVSLIEIETEEEAVQIANDTEYGLSSAVFTRDLRRGLRFSEALETGAVHINSMSFHDEESLPHGGAKASGYGRFNSLAGLEEWTWTKNITYDC